MAFTAESTGKPQGSSERVLPWQITMDQLIFASLSHTHYWYEAGTLKVPAVGWVEVYHEGNSILYAGCRAKMVSPGRFSLVKPDVTRLSRT